MSSRQTMNSSGARAALSAAERESASLRAWVRKAFPLADGMTYLYAAGVMGATWIGVDLVDKLGVVLRITK